MFGVKDFVMLICGLHCSAMHATSRLRAHANSFFPVLSGLVSPHPACSLRERADLPAWRGGEIRLRARPHSPFPVFGVHATPHPASSLREHADLPAGRGGEIRLRARPHSPFPVFGVHATPHPACSLGEQADLPAWRGGEITSHFVGRRDTPPGLPALPFPSLLRTRYS